MSSEHATAFREAFLLTCSEIRPAPDPAMTRTLTEQERTALLTSLQSN
jgi:hypothetical protein